MTEKEFLLLYQKRKKLKTFEETEKISKTILDSLDYALEKDGKLILKDWIISRKRKARFSSFSSKNILKRKNIKYRKIER